MTYTDIPVTIPLLATGYLLTIYLLLILAQRTDKRARYVGNCLEKAALGEGLWVLPGKQSRSHLESDRPYKLGEPLQGMDDLASAERLVVYSQPQERLASESQNLDILRHNLTKI